MKTEPGATAPEIHYEETNWKAWPDFSSDGSRMVYSSYQNDRNNGGVSGLEFCAGEASRTPSAQRSETDLRKDGMSGLRDFVNRFWWTFLK
jgi:hypothetical protein